MNEIKLLLSVLETEMSNCKKQLKEANEDSVQELNNIRKRLVEAMNDQVSFSQLDVDALASELHFADDEEIKKLNMYKKLATSKYFPLTEEQIQYKNSVINKMLEKVDQIILLVMESNSNIKVYQDEIEEIKVLIDKVENLENGKYLNGSDIEKITMIMKKNNIDIDDRTKILISLTSLSIQSLNARKDDNIDEDIIEVPITDLEEKDLIELFAKYNYDFEDFAKHKGIIIAYGNLSKISSMLDALKSNGILLNIPERASQLSKIFIHSNASVIINIITNIKNDLQNADPSLISDTETARAIDLNTTFRKYLDFPSLFIKEKRKYARKGKKKTVKSEKEPKVIDDAEKQDKIAIKSDVVGAYNNYNKNRQTFSQIGINLQYATEKCISIFTESNERIVANIKALDFYNFPSEKYKATLSSLAAWNPLEVIDKFIELGCYEYLLSNVSRLALLVNDPVFYRIKKAKLEGKTNSDLYREYKSDSIKIEFKGEITNPSKKGYGIDYNNGKEVVGQYIPEFDPKYDEVVNNSSNMGPILYAKDNYFIKQLEKQCKVDEYMYDLNGIIISRYKVLRIYETLIQNAIAGTVESVKYAICKNSILTGQECMVIDDVLDKLYSNVRGVGAR